MVPWRNVPFRASFTKIAFFWMKIKFFVHPEECALSSGLKFLCASCQVAWGYHESFSACNPAPDLSVASVMACSLDESTCAETVQYYAAILCNFVKYQIHTLAAVTMGKMWEFANYVWLWGWAFVFLDFNLFQYKFENKLYYASVDATSVKCKLKMFLPKVPST